MQPEYDFSNGVPGKDAGRNRSAPPQTRKYTVILNHSEEGYNVSCLGLPGCVSQGDTEAEALENIREAIEDYLQVVQELAAGQETRVVEIRD